MVEDSQPIKSLSHYTYLWRLQPTSTQAASRFRDCLSHDLSGTCLSVFAPTMDRLVSVNPFGLCESASSSGILSSPSLKIHLLCPSQEARGKVHFQP